MVVISRTIRPCKHPQSKGGIDTELVFALRQLGTGGDIIDLKRSRWMKQITTTVHRMSRRRGRLWKSVRRRIEGGIDLRA